MSKNYFSQVYRHKFGKKFIKGVNLVQIGHFWRKLVKMAHFSAKMTPEVKILGKWKKMSKKFGKI